MQRGKQRNERHKWKRQRERKQEYTEKGMEGRGQRGGGSLKRKDHEIKRNKYR